MSGDVWEHLVGMYLTRDRSVFVSPAYLLGESGGWESSLDYLALDIREQQVWAVEITVGTSLQGLKTKAAQFDKNYAPRIVHQLNDGGMRMVELMGWSVGLWAFVRSDCKAALDAYLEGTVGTWRTSAIEECVFDWRYWDERHRTIPSFETKV